MSTALVKEFKDKNLLVIPRPTVAVKDGEYFFQYLDGKYIDDIAKSFAKTRILCPMVTEDDDYFSVFKGYQYQLSSTGIELVSLFEDKNLNRSIPFNIWKLLRQYKQIKALARKSDVVFVFMPPIRAVIGIYLARKMNKKIILYAGIDWYENALFTYRWNKGVAKFARKPYAYICRYLGKWAMRHSPLRIVNGYNLVKRSSSLPGVTAKTIPLIHIEKNDFFFREKVCDKAPVRLLSVGGVFPRKGYEYLIEAVRIVRDKYPQITLQLSIAGVLREDDYGNKLQGLRRQYHLEDHILFSGYIGDRNKLLQKYRESDIFVISSVAEGFPRVIWEAMSQGLPVIASKITNIEYEFEGYNDAVLFAKQKDPGSFAQQIVKIINDKELRERMRKNARSLLDIIFHQPPAQQFIELLKEY